MLGCGYLQKPAGTAAGPNWRYAEDLTKTDLASCDAVFMTGADWVRLQAKLGTTDMPGCAYLQKPAGTAAGPNYAYAQDLTHASDISTCPYVALTGSEWMQVKALIEQPAPTGGSTDVNVSPEILLAMAVVVCFVLGWIAGQQR